MKSGNRNIALLLAGGKSERMGESIPKQYIEVDGESILLHTAKAFQRHPLIHELYVVCAPEWERAVETECSNNGIDKFRGTVKGGCTAFESIRNGIRALIAGRPSPDDIVLVHDAVRPLVSQEIISGNISVCQKYGNAITAIESHEAFAVSGDGCAMDCFMPRENIYRAQTPHTFRISDLEKILAMAQKSGVKRSQSLFTLAHEVGFSPICLTQGDIVNFKITYPSDIQVYRALKNSNT